MGTFTVVSVTFSIPMRSVAIAAVVLLLNAVTMSFSVYYIALVTWKGR
jgi:hypothetical protein